MATITYNAPARKTQKQALCIAGGKLYPTLVKKFKARKPALTALGVVLVRKSHKGRLSSNDGGRLLEG